MSEFMTARIFAIWSAVTLALISAILQFGEMVLAIPRAIMEGLSGTLSTFFGESEIILQAGAEQAAWSITEGTTALFGPATFPIAAVTIVAAMWVFAEAYERMNWNPFGWLTSRLN